jgi:hypothetical protein
MSKTVKKKKPMNKPPKKRDNLLKKKKRRTREELKEIQKASKKNGNQDTRTQAKKSRMKKRKLAKGGERGGTRGSKKNKDRPAKNPRKRPRTEEKEEAQARPPVSEEKNKNAIKRRKSKKGGKKKARTLRSLYVNNETYSPVITSLLSDSEHWFKALKDTFKAQEEAESKNERGPLTGLHAKSLKKARKGLEKDSKRTHIWDHGSSRMEKFADIMRMIGPARESSKNIREQILVHLAMKTYCLTRCVGSNNTDMNHVQMVKDRMLPISWGENRPMMTRITKKTKKKVKGEGEEAGEEGEEEEEESEKVLSGLDEYESFSSSSTSEDATLPLAQAMEEDSP